MGASISLVAGAAVALLVASFVFAYPGFVGGDEPVAASTALLLEDQSPTAARSREARTREGSSAVLIRPGRPARAASRPAARAPRAERTAPAPSKPDFSPGIRDLRPAPSDPVAKDPAAPAAPAAGDGVRGVGDAVTATVQGTGSAAGQAAAPLLGPPVTQAVQDVLDLLTAVLEGATGTLAETLDKTLPAR